MRLHRSRPTLIPSTIINPVIVSPGWKGHGHHTSSDQRSATRTRGGSVDGSAGLNGLSQDLPIVVSYITFPFIVAKDAGAPTLSTTCATPFGKMMFDSKIFAPPTNVSPFRTLTVTELPPSVRSTWPF